MAQIGIPYQIVAPAETVDFNDYSLASYHRLELVEGLDFPTLRQQTYPRAVVDGDLLQPAFRGARHVTLSGHFAAADPTGSDTLADELAKGLNSMVRADGTLRWQRRDTTWRRITCRVWEPLVVAPAQGWLKSFRFVLIAPDPYVYGDSLETHTDTTASTASTVTNDGNAESFPIVRVYGTAASPATAFTVKNVTTGALIRVTGLVTADMTGTTNYLQFDMAKRTITRNDDPAQNRMGKMDASTSSFWPLIPGANSIVVEAITGSTPSKFEVLYRDSWIGG